MKKIGVYLLGLHLLSDLDKEIRTVSFLIMGRDEVVEADETQSEILRLRVLQTCQDNLHNGDKVLLQNVPKHLSDSENVLISVATLTYGGKFSTTVSKRSNP